MEACVSAAVSLFMLPALSLPFFSTDSLCQHVKGLGKATDRGDVAAVVLVLFATFLFGGVTFEHFYCPGRASACADGSALRAGVAEGFRAEGQLEQTMAGSLFTGGVGKSMNFFTDYYCCCVHDFSRKYEVCKTKHRGNGLD